MPPGPSMRAKVLTAVPFVSTVFGVSIGFAACTDALHLDPPGNSTSTGTGTGTGGSIVVHNDAGPDAPPPVACRSNPDCAYPMPVCDTIAHMCVECLVIQDCVGKPGTVCSKGSCSCPSPDATAPLTYCAGETPTCVDTSSSPTNCGACGVTCFGPCVMGKCGNSWAPTSTVGAPEARSHHVAVWTGTKMFVWGGQDGGTPLATGGLYDPTAQTWTPTSSMNAPSARWDATAVWDDVDNKIIVWGGQGPSGPLADGARYDPAADTWTLMNGAGAPTARYGHSAVWAKSLKGFTGTSNGMIVWGGTGAPTPPFYGDGAVYDPVQDMWVGAVDNNGAPAARAYHVGVWDSGSRMVIVGGQASMGMPAMNVAVGDAFGYDPSGMLMASTTWTVLPSLPARYSATGIWDPISMNTIVWSGFDGTMTYLTDGAQLNGATWTTIGSGGTAIPEGRVHNSAVILAVAGKSQLVVFGGDQGGGTILDTGWSLDITSSTWTALPTPGPSARTYHTAVANGSASMPGTMMILWGGHTPAGDVNTGATYIAP